MQSYDKNDNIVESKMLNALDELEIAMEDPDIRYVTVGKLPYKGDELRVNGLRYKVIKRDRKNRQLILELL